MCNFALLWASIELLQQKTGLLCGRESTLPREGAEAWGGLRISDMGFCILLAASTTNGSLSTRIINLIVLLFLLLATNKRMTTVMESRHELYTLSFAFVGVMTAWSNRLTQLQPLSSPSALDRLHKNPVQLGSLKRGKHPLEEGCPGPLHKAAATRDTSRWARTPGRRYPISLSPSDPLERILRPPCWPAGGIPGCSGESPPQWKPTSLSGPGLRAKLLEGCP